MKIFRNFLEAIFGKTENGEIINLSEITVDSAQQALVIDLYALQMVTEIKAKLLANCEYKTYRNGKEKRGALWTQLNYQPNINQSATEFWTELYAKALYYGEVLVFPYQEQFIIADSFDKDEYAIKEQSFRNITRGDFVYNRSFRMSEVIYFKYQNEAVRQLKNGIMGRFNALASAAADNYEKAGGEKVFLNIPAHAQGMPDFETKYKDLMENRFRSFFKQRNAVLPLFSGMQGAFHTTAGSGKQIEELEKLLSIAVKQSALAQGISPALVTGEVAGIKDAMDWSLTVGIDPVANAVSEEITTKLWSSAEIAEGNYIFADTTNIKHVDIFDISSAADKLIACGMMSVDETRAAAGLPRTGEEWAQKHFITKNYEEMTNNTQ